jgi:hypothetical protein
MVADIRLLQGKIIEDLELKPKNYSKLIEELTLEILGDEESDPSIVTGRISE